MYAAVGRSEREFYMKRWFNSLSCQTLGSAMVVLDHFFVDSNPMAWTPVKKVWPIVSGTEGKFSYLQSHCRRCMNYDFSSFVKVHDRCLGWYLMI